MKLLLASLLLVSTAYAAPVELTDTTGDFKIRCTIVRIDGDLAVLKPVDGDEIKVPLNKLSADSLVTVIKELSIRLPKPPPKLEKPMVPPQEADRLNKEAILYFRELKSPQVIMQISPATYDPVGGVQIIIQDANIDVPALIRFRRLKDLSQVSSLEIEIRNPINSKGLEQLPAIINLFEECSWLSITAFYSEVYRFKFPVRYPYLPPDRRHDLDAVLTGMKPNPPLAFIGDIALPKLKTLSLRTSFSSPLIEKMTKRSPLLEEVELWSSRYFDKLASQNVCDSGLESLRFLNELPLLKRINIRQFEPPSDIVQVLKQAKLNNQMQLFFMTCTLKIKNHEELFKAFGLDFKPNSGAFVLSVNRPEQIRLAR
jgi:hypothetical protein